MNKAIYLDYSATTPVDPRVAQKMSGCLLVEGKFGILLPWYFLIISL